MAAKKYSVSDGQLLLTLERDGAWFVVTSPTDPAMITQAKTIDQAFESARDTMSALALARADKQRWDKPQKRVRKIA